LTLHPWVKNFEKKKMEEKIDVLKDRVKELDNLVGTSSVLIICMMLLCIFVLAIAVIASSDVVGMLKSRL
jgi:hypothetical protein